MRPARRDVTSPIGADSSPRASKRDVLFALLVFGSALDAYSIFGVPIQWLVQIITIAAATYLALKHRVGAPPGFGILVVFLLWAVCVTGVSLAISDYESQLPPLVTTPYPLFLALRFASILAFMASLYIVWSMLARGRREAVVRSVVLMGTAIAVLAIYIYVAEILGLPEPPRTRLGTSGVGVQSITFTYAFHRALGTFREPSLLGAWLLVPLFLSMTTGRRVLSVYTVIIGAALLLTGSLSSIVAVVAGLLAAVPLASRGVGGLKAVARAVAALAAAFAIFSVVAVSNSSSGVSLFAVIGQRLAPILSDPGLSQTDRGYIADYVAHTPLPYLGSGLGNADIQLSSYLHSAPLSSFISLYLTTAYSLGVIGLLLLGAFLLTPVLGLVRRRRPQDGLPLLLAAAYAAWIVVFAVAIEEFSLMFAIAFALLAFETRRLRSETLARPNVTAKSRIQR
jgi:O-antigen ligase